MTKHTVDIQVQNIDEVRTLLELLHKHWDQLPDELVESLRELADSSAQECDVGWWGERGYEGLEARFVLEGAVADVVYSFNPITRRVTISDYPGAPRRDVYPTVFSAYADGTRVAGWGDDA